MLMPDQEVTSLLTANGDPHDFQLSPKQVETLQNAALLIRASADDGGWKLHTQQQNSLDLWPSLDHGWLVPSEVRTILPILATALAKQFPAQQELIKTQLAAAIECVNDEEVMWHNTLLPLQNSGVILQHPAWNHLFEANGVTILATLESKQHHHEHGPHALEHAVETMESHPQSWLIGDKHHNNRSLEWLANQAASPHTIIYLDALGNAQEHWLMLSKNNRTIIDKALTTH